MIVTPAQAGVHRSPARAPDRWLPAFAGMTQEETYVILEPDPDDLARVKQWFHRLSERVRAVDLTGAHPLFAEDMIAFGTFENFITGRDRAEAAQWRNVWPVTSDFCFGDNDIRAIVSPDRLMAVAMGVFSSTGYFEDGTSYPRPGRTTIALSRRAIGEDWVADHTHMSLFRDVPSRSFGRTETAGANHG